MTNLPPPDPTTFVHDRFFAPAIGAPARVDTITGQPTDEEVVAITAAIEQLWPKPVLVLPVATERKTPPWRFSGRWWVRPVAARRDRPFY
jgi:hypothetical protein